MKIYLPIIILICFFFAGCKKSTPGNSSLIYLKATVVETSDFTCYQPVVDFSEDSIRVFEISNVHKLRYNIIRLPSSFNVLNKKLYISVSKLGPEDFYICNTAGIPFPGLHFVDAKDR
jgi:hypothetical protein